jgi:hypothetical protein
MGERGKAPRSQWAAGRGLAVGPALPEGKAGRAGCGVVPGGDLVRAVAVAGGGGSRPGCRHTCPPGRVTGPGAAFGAGAFGADEAAGDAGGAAGFGAAGAALGGAGALGVMAVAAAAVAELAS